MDNLPQFYQSKQQDQQPGQRGGKRDPRKMRFGVDWRRLGIKGVDPYQTPGMIEAASYYPIDYIRDTYGIPKGQLGSIHAYLGKGIKDEIDIEIIDQYFRHVLENPIVGGAAKFFRESDFEPESEIDPEDARIAREMEDQKEKEKVMQETVELQNQGLVQGLMQQNQLLMQLLFPNGTPNADQLQQMIAQRTQDQKADITEENQAPKTSTRKKASAKKEESEDQIGVGKSSGGAKKATKKPGSKSRPNTKKAGGNGDKKSRG